jgi:hypothetical protein
MSTLAMEFTAAQMLVAAVVAFMVLVAVAIWFYRAAAEDDPKVASPRSVAAPKPPIGAPRPFIPVVRPPSKPAGASGMTAPQASRQPFGSAAGRVTNSVPPPKASAPKVRPPASLELIAEVAEVAARRPILVIKARGVFPRAVCLDLTFDLNFILADDPSAQVRRGPVSQGDVTVMAFRLPPQLSPANETWFDLLTLPVDEFLLPRRGTHRVRIDCKAQLSDAAAVRGGAASSEALLCAASAEVALSPQGMGYLEWASWLASREAALGVAAACAGSASPEREAHREVILKWISAEGAALNLPPTDTKSAVGSLLACFGSCQVGVIPSAVSCEALAATLAVEERLHHSLGALFEELVAATSESVDPLDRIEHACHWLKIPISPACGKVRRRINTRDLANRPPPPPTTPTAPPPPPPPIKPKPQPAVLPKPAAVLGGGLPFAVSFRLIGAGEAAKGFRVFISGDMSAAVSADVQVAVSVVDADDDAKRAFLTLPDDIDVIGQVLLPKTVFPHAQYDARAPRQVAEILFADCAYPRSGERTLRVISAAYAVAPDGSLTHLCSTEISAPIKLPGVGYVLQQKRRRVQRGLALQLALATVGFAGPVALAQKSLVKDWIDAEAAKINDQEEARLTVNYLTKILLKADPVTHAELIALAIELAGRGNRSLSGQAIQLAEKLLGVKAGSESIVAPYLVKVRQELGLPVKAGASPVNRPIKSPPPKAPKARPPAPSRPSASPAVRRALTLNRKLGRSVPGWSGMKPEGKVAHLREELWLNSSRMASKNGLSERHELQLQINDLAELVVLIRNGQV